MNNQLIEKVIKSNDAVACPELTYENPLLDRNVAKALSKSFVKILRVSQQNSNINNNLRHSILANIRKVCRIQPENHTEIGDTATNLMTEVYIEEVKDPHSNICIDPVEKKLDDFIIRRLKELDVNSNYQSSLNPEVAQSLINLDESGIETISQNILNINVGKKRSLTLVKDLWTRPLCETFTNNICDISIRMKPELEKYLLDTCHRLLTEQSVNLKELFNPNYMKDLVQKCSISPECFQICCGILNSLFINVNYNINIQLFISEFVKQVKGMCENTISVLYTVHLSHIVVLLDFDVENLPMKLRSSYIKNTLPYLNKLQSESQYDFVLLLSHYPDWFNVYFEQ